MRRPRLHPRRLLLHLRRLKWLTHHAAVAWWDNNAFRLAASLAFYTLFSISPLLVISVSLVDWLGGPIIENIDAADPATRPSDRIYDTLAVLTGPEIIEGLRTVNTRVNTGGGTLTTLVSVVTLLVGVTAIFAELQDALNLIFRVEPKERLYRNAFWTLIRTRLLGFGVAVSAGFLLLVSLLVSAVLSALVAWAGGVSGGQAGWLLTSANFTLSIVVTTLLFMLVYRLLPDVRVRWADVALGALVTSLLFNVGKYAIGQYLARFAVGSASGAAGSFVVFLLWVFYSALICFFGAEFTHQVVRHRQKPEIFAKSLDAPTRRKYRPAAE